MKIATVPGEARKDMCDNNLSRAERKESCEMRVMMESKKLQEKQSVLLPGWTKEDQASDRLVWVVETSPRTLNSIGNHPHSLVLADDPLV